MSSSCKRHCPSHSFILFRKPLSTKHLGALPHLAAPPERNKHAYAPMEGVRWHAVANTLRQEFLERHSFIESIVCDRLAGNGCSFACWGVSPGDPEGRTGSARRGFTAGAWLETFKTPTGINGSPVNTL